MPIVTTSAGEPVRCDGCGVMMEVVDSRHLSPAPEQVWGVDACYVSCSVRCRDLSRAQDGLSPLGGDDLPLSLELRLY